MRTTCDCPTRAPLRGAVSPARIWAAVAVRHRLPSRSVVLASGMAVWEERLRLAWDVARVQGHWLASAAEGPLVEPLRLAGWDTWKGVTADHFQGLIVELSRRHLDPLAEQVLQCADALEQLQRQAQQAATTERAGLPPGTVDVDAGLRPWRSWPPAPSVVLAPGWNRPPPGRVVFMDVEAVRRLARALRSAAEAIRTSRLRLRGASTTSAWSHPRCSSSSRPPSASWPRKSDGGPTPWRPPTRTSPGWPPPSPPSPGSRRGRSWTG